MLKSPGSFQGYQVAGNSPYRYKGEYGGSINAGTPKWMGFIVENPIEMDNLGGNLV